MRDFPRVARESPCIRACDNEPMPERTLLTHDYTPITALDATAPQPLVTPNARLVSRDRHVTTRSTGATVASRSSGRDAFARGGMQPFVSPKSPLVVG